MFNRFLFQNYNKCANSLLKRLRSLTCCSVHVGRLRRVRRGVFRLPAPLRIRVFRQSCMVFLTTGRTAEMEYLALLMTPGCSFVSRSSASMLATSGILELDSCNEGMRHTKSLLHFL